VQEFIGGKPSAAKFIFSDPHFSGSSFREILNEIGKLELVENTMVALMHVSYCIYVLFIVFWEDSCTIMHTGNKLFIDVEYVDF